MNNTLVINTEKYLIVQYIDGGSPVPLVTDGTYNVEDAVLVEGRTEKGGKIILKDATVVSKATVEDLIKFYNNNGKLPDWRIVRKIKTAADNGGRINKILIKKTVKERKVRSKEQIRLDAKKLCTILQESHPTMMSTKDIAKAMGWNINSTSKLIETSMKLEEKIIRPYRGWYISML